MRGTPGCCAVRYDVTQRAAFGILNLRFGLTGPNRQATVFADKMLNRRYLNEVISAIEFGGSCISPGDRRRVGVELAFKI